MICRRSVMIGLWLLGLLSLSGYTIGASATEPKAVTETERVALPGHVLPNLSAASRTTTAKSAATQEQPLTITVVMRRSDETGFQRFLVDLYDPASSNYRRFLTSRELAERYGPTPEAWDAVVSYFVSQGFTVVEGSANRMTLVLTASRAQVAKTFAVELADFQQQGKHFFANVGDPSLPKSIADYVLSVSGLTDLPQATRMGSTPLWVANPSTIPNCTPDVKNDPLGIGTNICKAIRPIYYGFVGTIYNFFCSMLWNWFGLCKNLGPLPADLRADVSGHEPADKSSPAGQIVGLAQFDSFRTSDVADFLALAGAPAAQINQLSSVAVNGGASLGPNQSEVLIDITAVMTTAPEAQVVVYSSPFAGAGSFQSLFNRMISDGVTVISNSWGYCENQTTQADVQGLDSVLAGAAAAGITAFSSSGDTGSTCLNGSPNTILVPADSPHITAIGGTTVTIAPGGTYGGETWWQDKGGFGVSRFFARPSFQDAQIASATRSIPDLALNADPASYGVIICEADAGGCPTGLSWGGTSAAAPYMAGMMVQLNESLGSNVGWLNPRIYPLAGTPAFHTPASMGSDFAHVGLGSPNGSLLAVALQNRNVGPADAAKSHVTPEEPSLYADGSSSANVIVQLRDARGFTVTGKTVSLSANAGSSATVTPASGVSNAANGTVVFAIKDTVPETITLSAFDVTDQTAITETAVVIAYAPPADLSSISAFPVTVSNNGVATTTITVTLKNGADPSPGKAVVLTQGSGHSIIAGPPSGATDASGQIQFTATDLYAETVTYTATDVTDGNLVLPNTAVVTFTGQPNSSCATGAAPVAASGYTLTPFSTGYVTSIVNVANVTWGCRGASNPAFAADGSVYVNNFVDGGVFKLPSVGGAADSSLKLSTLGVTLYGPAIGKDGRLYAARGAAGGNFDTGAIYELDPNSGEIVRSLISGLTCPTALAVDPLSGDLFFGDSCFGSGSDNPSLWRLMNPTSANPTLTVYATLPSTPTGWISFAPDGTIYMPQTLAANGAVVRIGGTNTSQPASVTVVPGVTTAYWITVGEALPSGAAKSLIILDGSTGALRLADITTNPPTYTDLMTPGPGSGMIGPDGCLYVSALDTIYKLAPSSGGCGFAVTSPAAVLRLSPATVSPDPAQGTSLAFTAQFANLSVPAGTPILFSSVGANGQQRLAHSDANGQATISYTGVLQGADNLVASATVGNVSYSSNTVRINWEPGKHASFLNLNASATGGTVGQPVTLTAALSDLAQTPNAPIVGASIQFVLGALNCGGTTDANGVAQCAITPGSAGSFGLTASYAGDATHLPASANQQFTVMTATASVASSPLAIDFGSQTLTTTSALHSMVLTNVGASSFTLSSIALGGANLGDFALGSGANACVQSGSIAANGGTCTLYLSFSPTDLGARAATVTAIDSGAGNAIAVTLSGVGTPILPVCFNGVLPGGGDATACVTGTLATCQLVSPAFVPVSSVADPPPAGVLLPYGLFRFTATACGSPLSLSISYPGSVPTGSAYYKYGPTQAQNSPHWYSLPALVSGNTITVSLVDGGAGDDDLSANGTIVDPGGAGVIAAATSIPTLDRRLLWGLLVLLSLAAIGVLHRRRACVHSVNRP